MYGCLNGCYGHLMALVKYLMSHTMKTIVTSISRRAPCLHGSSK